jgi:hypothetical protein
MEIFDTFYRPDTPSQRYRLLAVSLLPIVAGWLPWIKPLYRWAATKELTRVAADVWATGLKLWGTKGAYPSPQHVVQALLVVVAASALLSSVSLQVSVLRGFAPGSRMLRLSQKLLCLIGVELVALIWAWPGK